MTGEKQPKILLFGDYSNYHNTLAKGLRNLGCNVTVVSDGSSYMDCNRDIDIRRRPGKIGGLMLAARLYGPLHSKLKGYDIVSFRDPTCIDLRPHRIQWFLKRMMSENHRCFLSYISTDLPFLDMLEADDSPLRYSEWFIDGRPNRLRTADATQWDGWHAGPMKELNEFFYSNIHGVVTSLYEYHVSATRVLPQDKIAYGGMPIDTKSISFVEIGRPKKVKIFLGRDYRRKLQKGSDLLEEAARNVVSRHPEMAELIIVENRPRKEYMEIMRGCHMVLDQIYSYTPATMALESMASGLTVMSGAEPEYYEFIGEKENFPIINAPLDLESIEKKIEDTILKPEEFESRGRRSREFVVKHNDMEVVARRNLEFWLNKSKN